MPKKHSPGGCPCCDSQCPIFEDAFDRADSTTVGNGWTEVSGDWEILTQQLRENGTSGAVIINSQTFDSWIVTVDTPFAVEDAVYRLIANYVDANNYHFADFSWDATPSPNEVTISLYKRSAGANTLLKTITYASGQFTSLLICLSERLFLAQVAGETPLIYYNPSLHALGKQAGLGNGSAIAIDYDNVVITETSDTDVSCPDCGCRGCPDSCAETRANLTVTFHSSCAALDGETRTLVWDAVNEYWIYEAVADVCFCDVIITITETCTLCPQASGIGVYVFSMTSWCWEDPVSGMRPGGVASCPNLSTSTCAPFRLYYPESGSFTVQWGAGDGCDCGSGTTFTVDVAC